MPEKVKPVGAVGALVSSLTICVAGLEMLPTLSSTIQVIVVVPWLVTLKLAEVASTSVPWVTTSLPLIVGVEPSVV